MSFYRKNIVTRLSFSNSCKTIAKFANNLDDILAYRMSRVNASFSRDLYSVSVISSTYFQYRLNKFSYYSVSRGLRSVHVLHLRYKRKLNIRFSYERDFFFFFTKSSRNWELFILPNRRRLKARTSIIVHHAAIRMKVGIPSHSCI